MSCSEILSNAVHGTKKSVISKVEFFLTRIFPILSEFSFTEDSQNMGQHGKGSTMGNFFTTSSLFTNTQTLAGMITAQSSPRHIDSDRDSNWKPLFSERKLLITKLLSKRVLSLFLQILQCSLINLRSINFQFFHYVCNF